MAIISGTVFRLGMNKEWIYLYFRLIKEASGLIEIILQQLIFIRFHSLLI